jgi:mono/diheme cytochrome c family protein
MPAQKTSRSLLRTVARWTARLAAGAVGILLLSAGAVYGVTGYRMTAHYDVPTHDLTVRSDAATIARGARLAKIKGCVDCHGDGLVGSIRLDEPAIGRLAAPNLTPGGRGAQLTTADFERAIRHGVRRDGQSLMFMPAEEFQTMTDEDVAAIVAYARALPASPNVEPPSKAGPVLRALYLAGQVHMPAEEVKHTVPHLASIAAEPTPAYGKYLAAGCTGCHGAGFGGGKIPGAPPDWKPAANITPGGIGSYSEADFTRVLRTGMRPGGTPVDTLMPWKLFRDMTDTEIQALYRYLRTVPAKAYGTR